MTRIRGGSAISARDATSYRREHSVVLDPAYAHITKASLAETQRIVSLLASRGVHSVGRYGRWTYCSIEDNLVETRALAHALATL